MMRLKKKGASLSPIVLWSIVGSLIAIVVVVSISIYTGVIDLPERVVSPEPLPDSGREDYNFLPEYVPGEEIYEGVDNNLPASDDLGYDDYCGDLYDLNESKDLDCQTCLNNIDNAKEQEKKDNSEYAKCPFIDTKSCTGCIFIANVVNDPRECGGNWKLIYDTDPCEKDKYSR